MAKHIGMNNNNLKLQNRGLILKLLATHAPISRIELANQSRLTKMSVTNIISEFIEKDYVIEIPYEAKCNVGRTPIMIDISPNAPKFIGLLINRDIVMAVLCDLKLNIITSCSKKITTCKEKDLLSMIYALLDEITATKHTILGIGVASIGPVDINKGIILNPPNFYGIQNVPLVELLKKRYHLPVTLDNHYNAAALAEKLYGNGKNYSDFIFLGITNGIGSGIISEGQLYRNATGLTSELGHTCINFKGNLCSCGNRGCLETYASIEIVKKRLEEVTKETLCFQEYCDRFQEPAIHQVLSDVSEKIAIALTGSVNLLNPQAILMGHESVYLPDVYLEQIETYINQYKLSKDYNHVSVIRPYFGYDSPLVGSACCLMNQLFNGSVLES